MFGVSSITIIVAKSIAQSSCDQTMAWPIQLSPPFSTIASILASEQGQRAQNPQSPGQEKQGQIIIYRDGNKTVLAWRYDQKKAIALCVSCACCGRAVGLVVFFDKQ